MSQETTAVVEGGLLSGTICGNTAVRVFKGVPYAAPPVGHLRWRAPQPASAWSGTYKAENFGPRCIQPDRPVSAIGYFGPEQESEDCLYLNIWTGARDADERRPVMVWFHGGGYAVGSGALPIFDGIGLACKGAVVVTVNYRLGRLGFLAHPELAREANYHSSGNYGWLDQIASLQWVNRNIAAFGGDPGRVTIFGQSVGSSSVNSLMASPLASGLFHRAIGESGGALAHRCMVQRDEAERAGVAFAQALGADTIEDLRNRPAREIQLVRPEDGGALKVVYDSSDRAGLNRTTAWSIIDGYVLRDRVRNVFERAEQNDVPLLTGATSDEGTALPYAASRHEFEARARADLGVSAEDYLRLYPAADAAESMRMSRVASGEKAFNWENWLWARLQARTGSSKVFGYHFSRVPPRPLVGTEGDISRELGAFHTSEIPYVFAYLQVRDWPWQESDRQLSEAMSSYWVNFAERGDPNGNGLKPWPRFEESTQQVMHFGDTIHAGPIPNVERLAFWQALDDRLMKSGRP
jgi:para-nitrobenzyl esterase